MPCPPGPRAVQEPLENMPPARTGIREALLLISLQPARPGAGEIFCMSPTKNTLLTERQKDVLRYRSHGLTQQQIAEIFSTTKANVCTIEKGAMRKIALARDLLNHLSVLEARPICTLRAGTDLFDGVQDIIDQAKQTGIPVTPDQIGIINRIRTENPDRIHGRYIRQDIPVYVRDDGELVF